MRWVVGVAAATATVLAYFIEGVPWLRWVVLGGAILGLIYAAFDISAEREKRLKRWFRSLVTPGPILWDFDMPIGGRRTNNGPLMVSMFQASGVVRRRTRINAAYIWSLRTKERFRALMSTDGGYKTPQDFGTLEPGTSIHAQASFGGELLPSAGGELTVPESEFREKWSHFVFVVEYEETRLCRFFTPQDVEDCIQASLPRRGRQRV